MNKSGIVITLGISVVVAGFFGFWYYRDKIFSKEILKLEILGTDTAKMGDEIEYTVKYKNNGNFVLEKPKLIFQIPDSSLTEDGKTRLTKELKDIYPGDENFVKFKVRLLGKEGDLRVFNTWLSYVPRNLSARYESHTTFTTKIESVPMVLDFDLPTKVEKGKEITYSINYFSNIDYPLENLSIKLELVSGFDFESSEPISLDNTEWKLNVLQKAQGGRVKIKGSVTAQAHSTLNFSAQLGMWQDGNFVVIKEASQEAQVINPLLFISEQINGSFNYIASPGESLHYEIFFRNIGDTSFDDLFIVSEIDGFAFDVSTLKSKNGQVRPKDNLIIWDSKQVFELKNLGPHQESKVEFDVTLKNNWTPSDSEKNNTLLKNKVTVSDISQEFAIKVSSNLELSQKAYHLNQFGIENSGPIPPEVNKTTTYTMHWQAKNYLNDVKNVKVRAILPEGVVLTSQIVPENQLPHFSLDNISREIVWSVGDLLAGVEVADAPPSIYFQVALTPGLLQQGKLAELIGIATISGEDQFTETTISNTVAGISTALPDDQNNSDKGIVQ